MKCRNWNFKIHFPEKGFILGEIKIHIVFQNKAIWLRKDGTFIILLKSNWIFLDNFCIWFYFQALLYLLVILHEKFSRRWASIF